MLDCCPLLKHCHTMWPLLHSDLLDKTFHTKIYSMVCWQKESLKNFILHLSLMLFKKKMDAFKLGKWTEFWILSVTFWFQASSHVKSEVSSVWAVKLPLSLSSLQCNHVICFSHWVCFTSQNHSGTVSLSGFHHWAFCHSPSTAALCLIIFTPSRAPLLLDRTTLLLDRVASPADLLGLKDFIVRVLKSWHFPERMELHEQGCCHTPILTLTYNVDWCSVAKVQIVKSKL